MRVVRMRMKIFLSTLAVFSPLFLWLVVSIFNGITVVSKEVEVDVEVLTGIDRLDQTDTKLWDIVRSHHITAPSVLEYSFGKDTKIKIHEGGVQDVIYPLFNNKTGGFFVEAGAYDGIASHTLRFERELGWNGLLIECNPKLLTALKSVNRKAFIADVCLSTRTHPTKMKMNLPDNFAASGTFGIGSRFLPTGTTNFTTYEIQTIPLYSILAAIVVKEVDLFVLDIQGVEIEILKTFPFELVLVKVWVIEVEFYPEDQRNWLKSFMASKGYPEKKFKALKTTWGDFMFVHESFQ